MNQFQEFNSVILTVDHTSEIPGKHSVQKAVFSTENLTETALSLFRYYGETDLLVSAHTIGQFQELSKSQLPGLVYRTPENVQIVLDLSTFNALIARSDSLLDATTFILDTVGEVLVTLEQANGDAVPLVALDWSEEEVAPVTPETAARPAKPRSRKKG